MTKKDAIKKDEINNRLHGMEPKRLFSMNIAIIVIAIALIIAAVLFVHYPDANGKTIMRIVLNI